MQTRPILILALFISTIFAEDRFSYQGMFHYELESIKANRVKSKDDNQHLLSFYSILGYELLSKDEKWGLNFEARANVELQNQNYQTPIYRRKFPSDEINFLSISMFSIDYYAKDYALSVGRNIIDLDYLSGSVDSILGIYLHEYFQVRAFWFLNYYDFSYNYYIKYQNLNDNKGIGGIHIQSNKIIKDLELKAYYYIAPTNQYLTGIKLLKEFDKFNLKGSLSYSDRDGKKSESFLELSIDTDIDDTHIFEAGYSKASEDGLKYMLEFGSYPFSKFYLTNSLDRDSAKNIYLKYTLEQDGYYINTIVGKTNYIGKSQTISNIVDKKLNSYEIDLQIGYLIKDNLLLEFGYMILDLDEKDSFEVDQNVIFLTLSMEL